MLELLLSTLEFLITKQVTISQAIFSTHVVHVSVCVLLTVTCARPQLNSLTLSHTH